jgi:hypothetical protein
MTEPVLVRGKLPDALPLILNFHYTRRRTADPMHVFLWRVRGGTIAAAVFTSPVNRYFGKGAVELARLVRVPGQDAYPMSQFVAQCLRWLKVNTDLAYCLSYADTTVGHVGTVYQAANFMFVAESKGNTQYRRLEDAKVVSGRSFDQCSPEYREGWERMRTGRKLLYVYPLRERRAKLLGRFGWTPKPYLTKADI